jgi:hypothetical protein
VALLAAVYPLWITRDLPMVDLPQHLYVLDVLHRLHDAATLYPQTFAFQFHFTPYLGYYAIVGLLHTVLPLEFANRLFLTATVAGLPLAAAFLLRSLGRPTWPALLVVSLSYGDNFAWGFVNTIAAIPLALLALGAFVRALTRPAERRRWTVVYATSLVAGFVMHPVPTGFLALALPFVLLTTRAPDDAPHAGVSGWLRHRSTVLAGTLPFLALAGAWLVTLGSAHPASGARGPLLAAANLVWEKRDANLLTFPWLLANIFRDGSGGIGLIASIAVALLACVARLFETVATPAPAPAWFERLRPLGLSAIAFGLFMTLPLNIFGAIEYLNPRFATLTAVLCVGLVPRIGPRASRWLPWCAAAAAFALALPVASGFRAFDREAATLRRLAAASADRPLVMGLMFDPNSAIIHHPVFLHAAATLARLRGGVPSYTLMAWPQVPLRYRDTPPPAPASEWRPDLFDYATMGSTYDHFLVRGTRPDSLFGTRLGSELRVAAHEGNWWLVRRSPLAGSLPAPAATPR